MFYKIQNIYTFYNLKVQLSIIFRTAFERKKKLNTNQIYKHKIIEHVI